MKRQFHQWYSKEVEKRVKDTKTKVGKVIDLKLGELKPPWIYIAQGGMCICREKQFHKQWLH